MPFSNQIACLGYQLEKQESSYSKHSKKWYYLEQRSLIYDFKKGGKGGYEVVSNFADDCG